MPVRPLSASTSLVCSPSLGAWPSFLRSPPEKDKPESAFVLAAAGAQLPENEVADVRQATEGWPAGVYFAALSICGRVTVTVWPGFTAAP